MCGALALDAFPLTLQWRPDAVHSHSLWLNCPSIQCLIHKLESPVA